MERTTSSVWQGSSDARNLAYQEVEPSRHRCCCHWTLFVPSSCVGLVVLRSLLAQKLVFQRNHDRRTFGVLGDTHGSASRFVCSFLCSLLAICAFYHCYWNRSENFVNATIIKCGFHAGLFTFRSSPPLILLSWSGPSIASGRGFARMVYCGCWGFPCGASYRGGEYEYAVLQMGVHGRRRVHGKEKLLYLQIWAGGKDYSQKRRRWLITGSTAGGSVLLLLGHWGQANILAAFWSSSRESMFMVCEWKRGWERKKEQD